MKELSATNYFLKEKFDTIFVFNINIYIRVVINFGKIFFMHPHIMKQIGNFVCPSVNQSVFTLTFKEACCFKISHRDTGERF